jgi:hypothetical protein
VHHPAAKRRVDFLPGNARRQRAKYRRQRGDLVAAHGATAHVARERTRLARLERAEHVRRCVVPAPAFPSVLI